MINQGQTAHELNEQGVELFKQKDYAKAATLFEQAVQAATISKSVYLCNLGDAFAHLNDWEEAIFQAKEALRYDPDYDRARICLSRWLFDYGQALHREKHFYEARYSYAEALIYNSTEELWHSELRKTVLKPEHFPDIILINFPEDEKDTVHMFITTLLYFYQEIEKPLKLFWATAETRHKLPLQEIPEIAHAIPDKDNNSILCHNIVVNAEHFENATIIEIMGTVAHELAHEAWKARDADSERFVPPFSTNDFTHSNNEWITDLQVLYRGFGTWLLKSREHMQTREMFNFTEQYRAMKPIEIHRRLRTAWDYRGQQAINLGTAKKRKGETSDAMKEFRKAERIWQRAVAEDPAYSYAHYELAVVYGWLDDWQQAFSYGVMSVQLEPSNKKFAQYLQEVIDERIKTDIDLRANKDHASTLMKSALSQWDTNREEAREVFLQAINQWQAMLEVIPLYAYALHEIGVAYNWLGDNEKAVEYIRAATFQMPTNHFYYASLADVYNKVKQHELAVSAGKSAVACNPDDARSRAILGKAHWFRGNLVEAEQSLQKAVQLAPGNQSYMEDLNKLREQLNT